MTQHGLGNRAARRRRRTNGWLALCGLAICGCASAPPVPVEGPPGAVRALVGEWSGSYISRATGRSGSIWFKLIEGEDHAHGDVMMTPRGQAAPYSRYPPADYPRAEQQDKPSRFLTIRFVRASGGEIRGSLEPYWDPECRCQATTTFHGQLSDDRIEGTFTTRLAGGAEVGGRWEAVRRSTGSSPLR